MISLNHTTRSENHMLDINLNELTVEELNTLKDAVTERLRVIHMKAVAPGLRVSFEAKGAIHYGRVVKRNTKSVTVVTDAGVTWRVGPSLLKAA